MSATTAETFIRGYCGWHIVPAKTETITVTGSGRGTLLLPTMHIQSVAAITDDGSPVDLSDVIVRPAGVLIRKSYWWSCREITVTLTHGYDAWPDDLVEVVGKVGQISSVPAGATVRVGNVSVSGATSPVDSLSQQVLDRYRLR